MKKIVLTYGLIASGILIATMAISWAIMGSNFDFNIAEITGYTSMIVALSMVYFGIRSYRESIGGRIAFGQAFKVGLLITLVASVMYVLGWEAYLAIQGDEGGKGFMQEYTNHVNEEMRKDGATDADIQKNSEEMAEFMEMYKNPLVRMGFTLMEIFPLGLLVSLICAAILRTRSRTPEPAAVM